MSDKEIIKRIWHFAAPYKWAFFLSYGVLLAELAFNQILPVLLSDIINFAVYENDIGKYVFAAVRYSTAFLGFAVCGLVQLRLWQKEHNSYIYDIRRACYEKCLRLKASVLSDVSTGDVIDIIEGDTEEFHHIIQRHAMRVINAGIGTVVSLGIVAYMCYEIALFMAVVIPFSIVITKKLEKKIKRTSEELRHKQGKQSSWLMEMLKGLREVKLFAAEGRVLDRFYNAESDIVSLQVKQDSISYRLDRLIDAVYFAADIMFYIICGVLTLKGRINIGEYMALVSYFGMITYGIKRVLRGKGDYQRRKTSVERVLRFLDEPEEVAGFDTLKVTKGEIEFKNVYFSYDKKQSVLENVNFSARSGEKIGIAGISGVGKSTLANLVLKFYDPDSGSILIDSQDISGVSYSSLRHEIGVVNQDCTVFDGTVRYNVTCGKTTDDDTLWNILEKVYLREDVENLPDGLDTVLGSGNANLSGGQAQRLCIARLIFREPKMIILDEATSTLDTESEKVVKLSLDRLCEGKTCLIISHRFTALSNVDKVLLIKDGKVEDFDTPDVLLSNNEYFADMFASQIALSAPNA